MKKWIGFLCFALFIVDVNAGALCKKKKIEGSTINIEVRAVFVKDEKTGECVKSNSMYFIDNYKKGEILEGYSVHSIKEFYDSAYSRNVLEIVTYVGGTEKIAHYFVNRSKKWFPLGQVKTNFDFKMDIENGLIYIVALNDEYTDSKYGRCKQTKTNRYQFLEDSMKIYDGTVFASNCPKDTRNRNAS